MSIDSEILHCETVINNINAVLEGKFTHDISQYQIGGRFITKITPTELMKIKNNYMSQLGILKNKKREIEGKNPFNISKIVFR